MSEDEKSGGSFPFRNRTEDGDVWRVQQKQDWKERKEKKGRGQKRGKVKKEGMEEKHFSGWGKKGGIWEWEECPTKFPYPFYQNKKYPTERFTIPR